VGLCPRENRLKLGQSAVTGKAMKLKVEDCTHETNGGSAAQKSLGKSEGKAWTIGEMGGGRSESDLVRESRIAHLRRKDLR